MTDSGGVDTVERDESPEVTDSSDSDSESSTVPPGAGATLKSVDTAAD